MAGKFRKNDRVVIYTKMIEDRDKRIVEVASTSETAATERRYGSFVRYRRKGDIADLHLDDQARLTTSVPSCAVHRAEGK